MAAAISEKTRPSRGIFSMSIVSDQNQYGMLWRHAPRWKRQEPGGLAFGMERSALRKLEEAHALDSYRSLQDDMPNQLSLWPTLTQTPLWEETVLESLKASSVVHTRSLNEAPDIIYRRETNSKNRHAANLPLWSDSVLEELAVEQSEATLPAITSEEQTRRTIIDGAGRQIIMHNGVVEIRQTLGPWALTRRNPITGEEEQFIHPSDMWGYSTEQNDPEQDDHKRLNVPIVDPATMWHRDTTPISVSEVLDQRRKEAQRRYTAAGGVDFEEHKRYLRIVGRGWGFATEPAENVYYHERRGGLRRNGGYVSFLPQPVIDDAKNTISYGVNYSNFGYTVEPEALIPLGTQLKEIGETGKQALSTLVRGLKKTPTVVWNYSRDYVLSLPEDSRALREEISALIGSFIEPLMDRALPNGSLDIVPEYNLEPLDPRSFKEV